MQWCNMFPICSQLSHLMGFEAPTLLRRSPATWLSASKPCSCKFRKLAFSKVLQVNMPLARTYFLSESCEKRKLPKRPQTESKSGACSKSVANRVGPPTSVHQNLSWAHPWRTETDCSSLSMTSIRHKAINQTPWEQQYNSPTPQRQCRWFGGLPRNKKQSLHAAASTLSLHQDLESNTYNAGCGCGFWQPKLDTTHLRDCSTTSKFLQVSWYISWQSACSRLTGQQQCRGHCASWAEFLKQQKFMPTAGNQYPVCKTVPKKHDDTLRPILNPLPSTVLQNLFLKKTLSWRRSSKLRHLQNAGLCMLRW